MKSPCPRPPPQRTPGRGTGSADAGLAGAAGGAAGFAMACREWTLQEWERMGAPAPVDSPPP